MPLIQSFISTSLSNNVKEELKSKFGEIIPTIPGKTEQWLMVKIQDQQSLYFRGTKDNCALIDVKLLRKADLEHKKKLVESLTNIVSELCSIPKDRIYITIIELNDWGWNGSLL